MAQHLNKIDLKKFPAASSSALEFSASTDSASAPRLKIEAGGKHVWSDGSVVGDTNLYRSAADTLKTDDYFIATGGLTVEAYQVTTVGASSGTVLKFDGTKFAPGVASTVGNLDDLTDVVISSPTTNQALIYNGTNWVNGSAGAAGSTYVATIGNGASTTFVVSHGLNTRDVFVQVRNANSPYEVIDVQWEATSTSTVTFNFGTPPASNSVRVAIYAATTGTNIALPLDGLTDVTITAPEEFQGLSYNGTEWVNSHIPLVSYVRNAEATTITTGTCVYLFGSTGDHATVKRASNTSDTTSSKTIGVAGANIAASQNGPIITRGYVDGIDLSTGYTAGDVLWLGTNGQFTKTKPTAPDHLVFIGVVVRATNNGIIYVATQNGYELDELHNVSLPSPQSGEFLKYNGSLWVADAIDLGTDTTGNYVQSVSAGTGVTVSGASGEGWTPTISIGQAVGTSDSPSFAGITVGGSVPAIYATMGSNKVGIGTNIPSASAQLTVKSTSTAFSPLVLQNASGQTASSQEWQNAMGSVLAYVSSTGDIFSYSTVTGASVSGWAIAQGGELASDTNLTLLYGTGGGSSPTQNASINVKRGISPTVAIRWNETTDKWQFTNDGTTYKDLGSGGITVSDTAPSTPATGDLWYESDTGSTYVYYDSYWIEIGGSTAYDQIIGTIQAKGDLLAGTASQAIARLAVGTNGTRLVADSTTATGLAWASDTQNTVIDAKGDLLVGLADNTVGKLTVGTDGQTLMVDSTQTNGVRWANPVTGFRNVIINGDFRINQRGLTSGGTTTQLYSGYDRWLWVATGGTVTYSAQSFTPGNAISGYEPKNFARLAISGQAANGDFCLFAQKIEDARTFAGQQVTLSFWAKSATGTPSIAVELDQSFGTGGSSSVQTYITKIPITTSWARYTATFTVPSISGKTVGSGTDSYLGLNFWYSSGTSTSARTGSLGIQNNTFDIWGVQLEQNTQATPFEQRPIGVELQLCQRYFERINDTQFGNMMSGYSGWNGAVYVAVMKIRTTQQMRGTVAVSASTNGAVYNTANQTSYNVGSWAFFSQGNQGFQANTNVAVATANGNVIQGNGFVFDVSAEL